MGRDTQGVRSMDLSEGDYVIDMTVIQPGDTIVTISSNGYGKRSLIDDYRLQSRAGKGIKAGTFNEKTGSLVGIKPVHEGEDLMMISSGGVAIRMQVDEISLIGRDTQGVKVMRLDGSEIASVAIAPHEDEEEELPEDGEESSDGTDGASEDVSDNEENVGGEGVSEETTEE